MKLFSRTCRSVKTVLLKFLGKGNEGTALFLKKVNFRNHIFCIILRRTMQEEKKKLMKSVYLFIFPTVLVVSM